MRAFLAALILAVSVGGAAAMSASSIPTKFNIPWGNSAGPSFLRPIPQASQIGIQNCAASLTDGFPPLTFTPSASGGCPPFGQDFNGILQQVTQWNQWQSAGGPIAYDSAFSSQIGGYPQGAVLRTAASPQCFWISTVDNNSSNPDTGGANWTNTCTAGGVLTGTWPNVSLAASGVTAGTYYSAGVTFGADGRATAATSGPVGVPGGYLTPCNYANSPAVTGCSANQMLPVADVAGVSTVYYGPWFGNGVPIYNGTAFVPTTITELSLTLPASFLSGTIRDACIFSSAGTPTLVAGPAWTTSTAGSGSRGSGGGTAQIALLNGIWVNAVAITGTNGATTYSVPANQCTMVGSLLFSANGQVTWTVTYGQNRQIGVANFYRTQALVMKVGDSTGSWTDPNTLGTIGPANGNAANGATALFALPTKFTAVYVNYGSNNANGNPPGAKVGVGYDATSSFNCGVVGQIGVSAGANIAGTPGARCLNLAGIGQQRLTALSSIPATAPAWTWFGTESFMQLTVEYQQ